jgi:hypothetical protein
MFEGKGEVTVDREPVRSGTVGATGTARLPAREPVGASFDGDFRRLRRDLIEALVQGLPDAGDPCLVKSAGSRNLA